MPVVPASDSESDSASDHGQLTPHLVPRVSITGWERLPSQSAPGSTSTPPVHRHHQRERLASPVGKGRGQRAQSQQMHPTVSTAAQALTNPPPAAQPHGATATGTAAASRSGMLGSPSGRRSRAGSDSATAATTASGSVGPFSLRALPVDGGGMGGGRSSAGGGGEGCEGARVRASWAGAWVLPQRRRQPSEPTHTLLPGGRRSSAQPPAKHQARHRAGEAPDTAAPVALNGVGGTSTGRGAVHTGHPQSLPRRQLAASTPVSLKAALEDVQEESPSPAGPSHSTGSWKHPQPRARAVSASRS
jgi:hypothetical protein